MEILLWSNQFGKFQFRVETFRHEWQTNWIQNIFRVKKAGNLFWLISTTSEMADRLRNGHSNEQGKHAHDRHWIDRILLFAQPSGSTWWASNWILMGGGGWRPPARINSYQAKNQFSLSIYCNTMNFCCSQNPPKYTDADAIFLLIDSVGTPGGRSIKSYIAVRSRTTTGRREWDSNISNRYWVPVTLITDDTIMTSQRIITAQGR